MKTNLKFVLSASMLHGHDGHNEVEMKMRLMVENGEESSLKINLILMPGECASMLDTRWCRFVCTWKALHHNLVHIFSIIWCIVWSICCKFVIQTFAEFPVQIAATSTIWSADPPLLFFPVQSVKTHNKRYLHFEHAEKNYGENGRNVHFHWNL